MPKMTASLHPVGVPNRAFAQWGMDLVGPLLGAVVCYQMVLTEYLTKRPEVYCIPNKEAITVSRCLKKLVGKFGVPKIIISDQGREFCNELNDNFCNSLGIARHICGGRAYPTNTHHMSHTKTAYTPHTHHTRHDLDTYTHTHITHHICHTHILKHTSHTPHMSHNTHIHMYTHMHT